jgi:hypothetical protein
MAMQLEVAWAEQLWVSGGPGEESSKSWPTLSLTLMITEILTAHTDISIIPLKFSYITAMACALDTLFADACTRDQSTREWKRLSAAIK